MGWGDCGTDSQNRNIGYVFEAICDHPGCHEKIDRGLSYACGDMHGQSEYDCEKYFCTGHLILPVIEDDEIADKVEIPRQLCIDCNKQFEEIIKKEYDL